ncbi:hypothetical protein Q7C30_000205 [Pseudomonas sp. RAC1]|uniref:hypothetical protein n=1 Tax=Pseudomonas sp. RAC1 TaxID=3064900 RepID=UPI0027286A4C|nr:hypothetical protein [Pseudomonas sp. RAC1]MDV9030525.1 hypothetical protein [Pseudomonas sp. RAC1]
MPTENLSSNTENAPCPFCGGQVDPECWLRGDGSRGPECESCGATASNLELCNSAQPAQQHQDEPIMLTAVATLVDDGDGGLEPDWLFEGGTAELFAGMTLLVAENAPDLCSEDGSAQVYTHPSPVDTAEVERLRAEVKRLQHTSVKEEVFDIVCKERDTLRAQMAEQATLVKWWKDHLAVHIAILFGTSGHSPEDAEKNADDVIKRAERLAPTVSASAEPGEIERLRAALKFYADREHFHFESGNWDTVSGEPLNILWCGDEPDFIEDGTVARNALSASAEPSAPVDLEKSRLIG